MRRFGCSFTPRARTARAFRSCASAARRWACARNGRSACCAASPARTTASPGWCSPNTSPTSIPPRATPCSARSRTAATRAPRFAPCSASASATWRSSAPAWTPSTRTYCARRWARSTGCACGRSIRSTITAQRFPSGRCIRSCWTAQSRSTRSPRRHRSRFRWCSATRPPACPRALHSSARACASRRAMRSTRSTWPSPCPSEATHSCAARRRTDAAQPSTKPVPGGDSNG